MDALMGFIVLTGPLFLILIFAVVVLITIVILMKKVTGGKKRLLGSVAILGIAFFILFGDEIIGRMYLGYLCENKTEWVIHKQIKLPAEYWNKDGSLKFPILKNGMANFKSLRKWYVVESTKDIHTGFYIHLYKRIVVYYDVATKQKVATDISFSRKYGWLNMFSPAPSGGETCRNILIRKLGKTNYFEMKNHQSQKFMNQLFTK